MKQQCKTEQVKTDRIKITVTVEIKSSTSELNKKTACDPARCCKR